MTLDDIGNLAELVAAFATLATLVYLGKQIRQNTESVRSSSYHEASTAWAELVRDLASQPELVELFHQGRYHPDELTKPQWRQFEYVVASLLSHIENYYVQYRASALSRSNQDRFDGMLRRYFATPGIQRYWARQRFFYTAEFIAHIEVELALASPSEPGGA